MRFLEPLFPLPELAQDIIRGELHAINAFLTQIVIGVCLSTVIFNSDCSVEGWNVILVCEEKSMWNDLWQTFWSNAIRHQWRIALRET